MNLPFNIFLYISFILSLYASQRWWKLLNRIGLSKGTQLLFVLVLVYLLMLVLQMVRDIRRGEDSSRVVRRGFYFSFIVGCGWAFLQYVGSKVEAPPIVFFYLMAIFYGLCLGLLSIVIANTIAGIRKL